MKGKPILISGGKRSLLFRILSALAFSLSLFFLIIFFTGHNLLMPDLIYKKYQVEALYMAIILFPLGILYSRIKNIFLDVDSNRYMEQWQIGPIKMGKWEQMEEIDFVCVFKSKKASGPDLYEVSIWFKSGRRKELFEYVQDEPAINLGKMIAKKLKRNFKDSSNPHNPIWIDYNDL